MQTHLNLEMAVTGEMLRIACEFRPRDCCLVPERREELTTEGGLDVVRNLPALRDACVQLAERDIRVSLFIDPDLHQIDAARDSGAPVIEIHTGEFAGAITVSERQAALDRVAEAARHAQSHGLVVNAGHGLNYHNVQAVAALPELRELNIGHAIISRAIFVGMTEAVREMKRLIIEARL